MEERGVSSGGLLGGGGVVRHSGHAIGHEENAEQVPSVLDDMRYASGIEPSPHFAPQQCRRVVDLLVDLRSRQTQRRQTSRGGDGVSRERPSLVDTPHRRQVLHQIGATAEGRGWEAATHDLAEGHQVRPYPIEAEMS